MKKYLSILIAVLFAATSATLTSCGDDDESDLPEVNQTASGDFTFNNKKLYVRDTGRLNNVRIDGKMQITFSLFQMADALEGEEADIFPKVSAVFEIKPIDVTSVSKGTKLAIIKSRYTWVEDYTEGGSFGSGSVEGVNFYFTPERGQITFEGYDTKSNTATVKLNLTMTSSYGSATLKGTVKCEYENESYTLDSFLGGEYE